MGTGTSRQQPQVHVVLVQPRDDGTLEAEHVRPSHDNRRETSRSTAAVQPIYTRYEQQSKQRRQEGRERERGAGGGERQTSPNPALNGNPEFKIFRTHDDIEYTVHVAEDGSMYYVDWDYQKWRVFPSEWIKRGSFETEGSTDRMGREGEFAHPVRGKMITILKQESLNVMYFFDNVSNGWLPMPLTWERQTPLMDKLVTDVKNACPKWNDEKSIVAAIRQCNYRAEDAVSFYNAINDEGVFDKGNSTTSDSSATLIEKLQQQIKDLENELRHSVESKSVMKDHITQLTDDLKEVKSENIQLKKELTSIRTEQQKQSVALQQSLGRGGSLHLPALTLKMNAFKPSLQGANQEVRAIKFKLQSMRQQVKKSIKLHNEQMLKLSESVKLLVKNYRQQANEIDEARALYRKEALQRKLLFNEIQELKGNIRVFCRCRYDPVVTKCAMKFEDQDVIHLMSIQGRPKVYEFEKVYRPETSQEMIFEDTRPIITSCTDGYNVCIIAYGQTGAGKTYTMMGPRENPGVNIRSIKELFNIMKTKERTQFTMKVSMVEVYNESIYDLLTSPNQVQDKLQIQKKGKDIHVPGLTEIEVTSLDDVVKIMTVGEKNRTTASTKMNTNSSRSHLLLVLSLTSHNLVSKTVTKGSLTLVDLAGSERISRSEATGLRLVEAAAINKSLSALGQVFASIRENSLHIPFRNSKLTHLLQPCLGGDAKACMFVNVSPSEANLPETISTLDFGLNARQVALGKATSHVSKTQ